MVVKVIQPGKPQDQNWQGICHRCGCEIVCSKGDVVFEDRPAASPYVPCPTEGCGSHIKVSSEWRT